MAEKALTKPKKDFSKRIFELDALRGLAILLMSLFHLVFDLQAYFGVPVEIHAGPWFYVGRSSAILFMLISGASSTLGGRSIRRGLMVLGAALLVTVASIPMMGEYYIRFGILHFFAAMMILKGLADMAIKNHTLRLILAFVMVPVSFVLGNLFKGITVDTPLLIPFGLLPPGWGSFDYYPIFPWAGVFCLGVGAGLLLYKSCKSLIPLNIYAPRQNPAAKAGTGVLRGLCLLGRHSLLIYLLHQPLILGILYLIFWLVRM